MKVCTKAQVLLLKPTKISATASTDNEVREFAEAGESREKAFARTLNDALSREGARFDFVFDYSKDRHARSLYAGCTLTKGN